MKTQELKMKLINRIMRTEDISLLEDIFRLMDIETSSDIVYELSTEEKVALYFAREQVENGQYLTQEEVDEKMKKCLEE